MVSLARSGVTACPSWCELGDHLDTPYHHRFLLHMERDGMNISVYLSQRKEHYDRPTPGGGRAGYVRIDPPQVCISWERGELDGLYSVDVDPVAGASLGDVVGAIFGVNAFASALAEAARLVAAESSR